MSLTIDAVPVIAAMNRLAAWSHSAWLAEVGAHQKHRIEERIRTTKLSPDDEPWAPWKRRTYEWRSRRGNLEQGLLWDTGRLLESPRFEVSGNELQIGTDVSYAHWLQDGTEDMAKRPFIGWSDADVLGLETSLVAHLNTIF